MAIHLKNVVISHFTKQQFEHCQELHAVAVKIILTFT